MYLIFMDVCSANLPALSDVVAILIISDWLCMRSNNATRFLPRSLLKYRKVIIVTGKKERCQSYVCCYNVKSIPRVASAMGQRVRQKQQRAFDQTLRGASACHAESFCCHDSADEEAVIPSTSN